MSGTATCCSPKQKAGATPFPPRKTIERKSPLPGDQDQRNLKDKWGLSGTNAGINAIIWSNDGHESLSN
jgi:hypothetical protein